MSEGRFIRRNRVDERSAAAIAVGFGIVASLAGARPTGSTVVDVILVFLAATAVVWASASAQWWASAGVSGIGAAIALQPIVAAVGALGCLGGLNVGTWRREQSHMRTAIGGVAVNVLIRSELDGFFGLSAIVGIALSIGLFVLGVLRRPSRIRRVTWTSVGAVGSLAVLACVAVGVVAVAARPDVTRAARSARQAVAAVNNGDYALAAQLFEDASAGFERSDGRLGGALALSGRLLPGVAQNLSAGADLSAAAAESTAQAAGALRQVDPTKLTVSGGAIDLAEVRAVEAPLQRVKGALETLRSAVDELDSPWLLGSVERELVDLDEEFADNEPRLQNAIDAVHLAPQILGETRARRYLLLFTTPAEARGLGGFVGSFAVLEVTNGRLEVSRIGRTAELSSATAGADCSACDPELLQQYGKFGFSSNTNGTAGGALWSNITMPAHFPYIADAASILYPQGFDEQIDGVVVLDPYVVQALMKYSGPVPVPELDVVVRPQDAAKFILEDQYLLAEDTGTRIEALDSLGAGAIAAILSGSLPAPPELAKDLGPLVAERRLLMWTDDAAEQELLDRVGMLGSIPDMGTDGGFSVSVTNASASKIDVFLDREVDVSIEIADDGTRTLVADVQLTNNAPRKGLPRYVIGNSVDLPTGSSRLFITFYGPDLLQSVTLDGNPYVVEAMPEAGWTGYSNFVDLAPGQQRTFRLKFGLEPAVNGNVSPPDPIIWEQPLSTQT